MNYLKKKKKKKKINLLKYIVLITRKNYLLQFALLR